MGVCGELLANGVCRTELCTGSHVLDFFCPSCNIICTGEHAFKGHLAGRKHRAALKTPTLTSCLVCPCVLSNSNPYTLDQHSQGSTHRRRLSQLTTAAPDPWYVITEAASPPDSIRCDACNQNVPSKAWDQHLAKETHIRRSKLASFQSVLRETEKDRHGVEVSHGTGTDNTTDRAAGIDFGTVDPSNVQEIKKLITLRLNTPAEIALTSVKLASAAGRSTRVVPQ
jgi:helicase MOV-10